MIIIIPKHNAEVIRAYRRAARELGCRKVAKISQDDLTYRYFVADVSCDKVFDFVLQACGIPTYQEYLEQSKQARCSAAMSDSSIVLTTKSSRPTKRDRHTNSRQNVHVRRIGLCLALWRLAFVRTSSSK